MTLDVSVAICTWNRCDLLESTFASLEQLTIAPSTKWELIVVDNASTDRTREIVEGWARKGTLPIRYAHETKLGLSNARNRAIEEARSPWILFTDDDVIVDPGWLEAFVAASRRHPKAGSIGGRVEPWFVETPDPDLSEAFPVLARGFCGIDRGPEEHRLPEGLDLFGANFSIRVDDVKRAFNPQLGPIGSNPIGGDELGYQMELRKAGLAIVWCPAMRVKHYVDPKRMTLDYLRKFHTNVGRHEVILHGVPAGTRIAGVPRWLVGLYLKHMMRWSMNVLKRNRIGALQALRQAWQIRGMIAESRSMALANPAK